jgi:hypothetical protein
MFLKDIISFDKGSCLKPFQRIGKMIFINATGKFFWINARDFLQW